MAKTANRPAQSDSFAADVRAGLSPNGQKRLSPQYLYDELGTALFEAITHVPEYGLTAAEGRLLRQYAAEIGWLVGAPALVAELGSGDGFKTRILLEAFVRETPLPYYPIDVSPTALARCRRVVSELDGVKVIPLESPFLEGLRKTVSAREPGQPILTLFLGSTIGNFEREDSVRFLRSVRELMTPGDSLLLGADLIKPAPQMLLAYDDPAGVTASFNLNLLARINRALGGEFNLRRFAHEARYNAGEGRIEMHLRSLQEQEIPIHGAGITAVFREGETIWTESCHKFQLSDLRVLAKKAGFSERAHWVDEAWPYALCLWSAP